MTTDNRTNEQIGREAIYDMGNLDMSNIASQCSGAVVAALEAAGRLVAAQGAAPARPVIDREELIDVLVMTDLSDYAGTDMRAINQCADAILAHLAADTGGQRDA